jgi:hypothetical protein
VVVASRLIATTRYALLQMNSPVVITSPAAPGVVIQLDSHVAPLLGMTFLGFITTHHAA